MIRRAAESDLRAIMEVYCTARSFMAENGNQAQWGNAYPPEALIRKDLERGRLFVCAADGEVHGAFALCAGPDPTYAEIEGGVWKTAGPYTVIHRLAGDGRVHGLFSQCMAFSRTRFPVLRADTHVDNHIMQHLLEKNGFKLCGIIHVKDGSPRIAYEYVTPHQA